MKSIRFEIVQHWFDNRQQNIDRKPTAFALNRTVFKKVSDYIGNAKGIAYISIESTQGCTDLYKYDSEHCLPDCERVCNVEFDDVEEDMVYEGHQIQAITDEIALKIVNFIESHIGDDFIIHCRAGKSRSQAIVRYIQLTYPNIYADCEVTNENPPITPNYKVLETMLKIRRKTKI